MKFFFSKLVMLFLVSCYSNVAVDSYWLNKTVYAKHGIHYQNGMYSTANVLGGGYIRQGSEITIIYVTSDKAVVLCNHLRLEIKNSERNSKLELDEVLAKLFSEQKVTPTEYPKEFEKSVAVGMPIVGMTKNQVIHCCGYPPRGYTPKLTQDKWRYFLSRYKAIELIFDKDILVEIKEPEILLNPYY